MSTVFVFQSAVICPTQQVVECVSCGATVGLWGQQRAKGELPKFLQAGGDPAKKREDI